MYTLYNEVVFIFNFKPVCLITPGPPNKQPSAACNYKTPVTPLHGKRKQSSCQVQDVKLCNYCNMMVENTCRKEAEKISGRNFVELPECLNFTQ